LDLLRDESSLTDGQPMDGDLQELRAYLQRGETRLSTLHRVAGSFLSGAGLLTLLPVLLTTTFSSLFSSVVFLEFPELPDAGSAQRWFALFPVLVALLLPLIALATLIRDLVRFYFTAHHFDDWKRAAYPRFILSGIKVSDASLSEPTLAMLRTARDRPSVTQLLVPSPDKNRMALLREARVVGELPTLRLDQRKLAEMQLRDFVFRYTATDQRSLVQEAAKMEASLARHHLLLRALVLRYAKAFLLAILTLIMTVLALAILNLASDAGSQASLNTSSLSGDYIWTALLGIFALWSAAAAFLVRQPIEWIYGEMDNTQTARTPHTLASFERVTLVGATLTSLLVSVLLGWFSAGTDSEGVKWFCWTLVATAAFTVPYSVRAIVRSVRQGSGHSARQDHGPEAAP
jgi:hypothetical protein